MRLGIVAMAIFLPVSAGAADLTAGAYQVKPSHNALVTFKGKWGPKLSLAWTAGFDGLASFPTWDGHNVDALVAGPANAEIVSVDGKSGAARWNVTLTDASQASGLAYDSGALFVAQISGAVTALSPKTGKVLWTTNVAPSVGVFAAPTALNGIVYVMGGGFQGELFALDGTSGKLLWTQVVAQGNGVAPTVTTGGVYVANGCLAYDFVPATGEPIWQYNGSCSGSFTESVLFGGSVYFIDPGQANVVLDAMTGAATATFNATATPTIHGNAGFFLDNATISAVDVANGKQLWTFTGDGSIYVPPIVVNDYVIAASNKARLYLIDSTTGKTAWSVRVGSAQVARPLGAGGGMIFVPLVNNTLAAYGSAP